MKDSYKIYEYNEIVAENIIVDENENIFWGYYNDIPEKILLTTYGLDIDFLFKELIPLLFGTRLESNEDWIKYLESLERVEIFIFMDKDINYEKNKEFNNNPFINNFQNIKLFHVEKQHSKLWLKKIKDKYYITISSCNLTKDAFSHQIQYLWSGILEKNVDNQEDNFSKELLFFIQFLFRNKINKNDEDGLKKFSELRYYSLNHKNINLIPNIPKEKSALEILNSSISKNVKNIYMQVFSVVIDDNFLKQFFPDSQKILFWPTKLDIKNRKLWQQMILNNNLIRKNKFEIKRLGFKLNKNETRLPHGKLYIFVNKDKEKYTLIGSSNLSKSAWQDEGNFELNVLIKKNFNLKGLPFRTDTSKNDNPYINNIEIKESINVQIFLNFGNLKDNQLEVYLTTYNKNKIKNFHSNFEEIIELYKNYSINTENKTLIDVFKKEFIIIKYEFESIKGIEERELKFKIPKLKSFKAKCKEIFPQINETILYRTILEKYGFSYILNKNLVENTYKVFWEEYVKNIVRVTDNLISSNIDEKELDIVLEAFNFFYKNPDKLIDENLSYIENQIIKYAWEKGIMELEILKNKLFSVVNIEDIPKNIKFCRDYIKKFDKCMEKFKESYKECILREDLVNDLYNLILIKEIKIEKRNSPYYFEVDGKKIRIKASGIFCNNKLLNDKTKKYFEPFICWQIQIGSNKIRNEREFWDFDKIIDFLKEIKENKRLLKKDENNISYYIFFTTFLDFDECAYENLGNLLLSLFEKGNLGENNIKENGNIILIPLNLIKNYF